MAGAGEQSQKQLLNLIRDFASERSQGERRVSDLKKRLLDLRAESDASTAELDIAKNSRETAEQELKGFQVQLSMTDASLVAQQGRISLLNEEINKVRADVDAVKNKEDVQRDEFIEEMYALNRKIRQFQESILLKQHGSDPPRDKASQKIGNKKVLEGQHDLNGLEDEITSINAQLQKQDEEYKKELNDHEEAHKELINVQKRVFYVEAVMEESKQLQELTKQTGDLEKAHAALGEELQRSYTCPNCQINNMGDLEGTETDVKN